MDTTLDHITYDEDIRHRVGARQRAFSQFLTLLNNDLSKWSKADNQLVRDTMLEYIQNLAEKCEELKSDRPVCASSGKKHYVGVRSNGERVHFMHSVLPTKEKFPQYDAVYGSYHTKNGSLYVVKNGIRETDKRVF